jgi:hypothetical protein
LFDDLGILAHLRQKGVNAFLYSIGVHAAIGSTNKPKQCFSQAKCTNVLGLATTPPLTSAGVVPPSAACVRE